MILVAVAGAAGRMGATVCDAVEAADDSSSPASRSVARTRIGDFLDDADVVVDFTVPEQALPTPTSACTPASASSSGRRGSTSRSCSGRRLEREGGAFVAPNFAIGAVLMMEIGQRVAEFMPEVEIVELHHDRKLDTPSGTAARTAEL